MDNFFLGLLALKHFDCDIEERVIVWHPQKLYPDLKRLIETSTLVKGYERAERPLTRGIIIATISEAHQKLIVIDGRIAFKGSANPTLAGWTREGELVEFVTDPGEIRDLNENFFAVFMARKRTR